MSMHSSLSVDPSSTAHARPNGCTTFKDEVARFASQVLGMAGTFPLIVSTAQRAARAAHEGFRSFIIDHCERGEETDRGIAVTVDVERAPDFMRLHGAATRSALAAEVVTQSAVISLVAQFDAYLGRLIRCMFEAQPAQLRSLAHTIDAARILEAASVEELRAEVIEAEVESVLRCGHTQQFEWLERRLGCPLRSDAHLWRSFIEVTQRRHLFVHCGGIVSEAYLRICEEHGHARDALPVRGATVGVSQEYFEQAWTCITGLGLMLGHLMWRRLLKDNDGSNKALLGQVVDMISEHHLDLAARLIQFALIDAKKGMTRELELMFRVNEAQVCKWRGDSSSCRSKVDAVDWSGLDHRFLLAKALLLDDLDEAGAAMRQWGDNPDLQLACKTWPLFQRFRETTAFRRVYEELFGTAWPETVGTSDLRDDAGDAGTSTPAVSTDRASED